MAETAANIYANIAKRTNGNIYIGVVGPVRTGKSTFVKRFMEQLVLPYIENIYKRERANDELPQSGSGRTIMTTEPKFVPETAAEITLAENTNASIRLIDSVGYMVPGVIGAEEDGKPRLVTTPWLPEEIPMTDAAEIGTKKVMDTHCTVGIVITTDGSVTDISRSDYLDAEKKAIEDMKQTGKPFILLLNTADPTSKAAYKLQKELENTHHISCCCVNCLTMEEQDFQKIIAQLVCEFPILEIQIQVPQWMTALQADHPIKQQIYDMIRERLTTVRKLRDAESEIQKLEIPEIVENTSISEIDPASGIIICRLHMPGSIYYGILSDVSGFAITDDADLLSLLEDLSKTKLAYDKISSALEEVRATGYGIVHPSPDEILLEPPTITRKGSNYGVKLKASAPSIHMMRADIETEISPIVGDEKQSEDLLNYLQQEYQADTGKIWDSNIFGKSLYDLVNEGLMSKLRKMPQQSRSKLQSTLSRMVNEGCTGLLCIILG